MHVRMCMLKLPSYNQRQLPLSKTSNQRTPLPNTWNLDRKPYANAATCTHAPAQPNKHHATAHCAPKAMHLETMYTNCFSAELELVGCTSPKLRQKQAKSWTLLYKRICFKSRLRLQLVEQAGQCDDV